MKLALSSQIAEIDRFAASMLGIPMRELMRRSGAAVAGVVRDICERGSSVIIFAGCGNNGGDGYAAAVELMQDYKVTVYDVFSNGQRTDEGNYFLTLFRNGGGEVIDLVMDDELYSRVDDASVLIDAVFGTGFRGELPDIVKELSVAINGCMNAKRIAVDVPIGIGADDGSASDYAVTVDFTVALSFLKPGLVSYPAKAYVGKIVHDTLGLPTKKIIRSFDFKYEFTDDEWATVNLPSREDNSSKGSFGKVLLVTGSDKYRGAAALTVGAALRGGVGYTAFYGSERLASSLSLSYPEVIYHTYPDNGERDADGLCELSKRYKVTLIGSGSDNTDCLADTVLRLLSTEGGLLVLDADAINALSGMGARGVNAIKEAKREVVITPHPLEFARLSGTDVGTVQLHRMETAIKFAAENRCTVVLKGAATVVTDGNDVYINGSGSSALAKAGSGDVLAGFLASFAASVDISPVVCTALSVFFHGRAADNLAKELSSYGVTPSDLAPEMARCIAEVQRNQL